MDCSHFTKDTFHPVAVEKALLAATDPAAVFCGACQEETDSRWICLSCGSVNCGRFVKGHASSHFNTTQHALSLDLDTKACHCYICDDYISAGELEPDLDNLRNRIRDILAGQIEATENDPPMTGTNGNSGKRKRKALQKYPHMTGLVNLGNTCFMNVILQTLCHTKPIQDYFNQPLISPIMTELDTSMLNKPIGSRVTRRSAQPSQTLSIWNEFCDLLHEMWISQSTSVSPESFLNAVWKLVPNFRGYQQQDAQEFVRYLLDQMHSELNSKKGRTLIMQIFQGKLRNTVTCLKCESVYVKKDPFLDLSLPIPESFVQEKNKLKERIYPCTLHDCLISFTETEKLGDTERYQCLRCNDLEPATTKLSIDGLPRVLCFHIKRFRFSKYGRHKVDTFVRFPITDLDMSAYCDPHSSALKRGDTMYDLYAVIVHHGTSGSGHFLVFVWSPENDSWFEMNDGLAKPTTPEVVYQQQAYMLFYLKRKNHVYLSPNMKESSSARCSSHSPHSGLRSGIASSPESSPNPNGQWVQVSAGHSPEPEQQDSRIPLLKTDFHRPSATTRILAPMLGLGILFPDEKDAAHHNGEDGPSVLPKDARELLINTRLSIGSNTRSVSSSCSSIRSVSSQNRLDSVMAGRTRSKKPRLAKMKNQNLS